MGVLKRIGSALAGIALHRTCYTIVSIVPRRGIFWGGLIFDPEIFWGFAGSPRDFFGSRLLAPFDHPHHLRSVSI